MNDRITIPKFFLSSAAIMAAFLSAMLMVTVFLPRPTIVNAQSPCGTWQEVPHPFGNASLGITAKSSTEAYALGYAWNDPPTANVITVGRWDGSIWSVLSSFTVTHDYNYVEAPTAIAAFAPNDIWMVGTIHSGPSYSSWARHWDGVAWTGSSLPSRGYFTANALSAISPTNIWVVGYDYAGPYSNVRVEHWNGVQWKIVAKRIFTDTMSFLDLKALAPRNIWIIGSQVKGSSYGTLTLRRGKDGWKKIPSPNPKPLDHARLASIDALSARNIWAVGSSGTYPNYKSLVEHWNGTKWNVMAIPEFGDLASISIGSTTDIWVHNFADIIHWDGVAWTSTYHVANQTGYARINDVKGLPTGEAWATIYDDSTRQGMILHYSAGLISCTIP